MDVSEQLRALAQLRERGALTEGEFQRAKARVLNESDPVAYSSRSSGSGDKEPAEPATKSIPAWGWATVGITVIVLGLLLLRDTYEIACELTGGNWYLRNAFVGTEVLVKGRCG